MVITETGKILKGELLHKSMIEHYENSRSDPNLSLKTPTAFPDLIDVTDDKLIYIASRIHRNKALSSDCISDTTFDLCRNCKAMSYASCTVCMHRISRLRDIFTLNFWNHPSSIHHLRARLIPLSIITSEPDLFHYPNLKTQFH